jgi:uncharacterized protein YoaH (UPF0181 family)
MPFLCLFIVMTIGSIIRSSRVCLSSLTHETQVEKKKILSVFLSSDEAGVTCVEEVRQHKQKQQFLSRFTVSFVVM